MIADSMQLTRRAFFKSTGLAAGRIALAWLLCPDLLRGETGPGRSPKAHPGLSGLPHFAPKARRLIYLFMNGAPSQIDLWDYKPGLKEMFDLDLPDSIRMGQRLTTMTSGQKRFPVARRPSTSSRAMASAAPGSANCCLIPPRS